MSKKGKVGCGGREIMQSLWGSRGRPETNAYAALCASRLIEAREGRRQSTEPGYWVTEVVKPAESVRNPEQP